MLKALRKWIKDPGSSLSNHQSWADIFIVQMITNRKVPMLKFFMKFVLIYVPVIGICWWALDMPFLKRYSKDQLERNPSLRGKDFASMKRSLKSIVSIQSLFLVLPKVPDSLQQKYKDQNSPSIICLNPKKEDWLPQYQQCQDSIRLLTSQLFTNQKKKLLGFLERNMNNARIFVQSLDIPDKFKISQLHENDGLRKEFKDWLNEIWHKKDKLINENKF